ncbi:aspartate racemase [Natranaerovirga pectinivora]|uniref:Aspartate racemase n=1 Tax=Natranaerovirga pectinivora TaxID=682400 RepID=A0A4V2UZV9_9FIRM|nr:amino acid racemase [Natranaerovirga pectinivora]TCT12951.1 aspartate racemase [Natranaerovirga pectinivora]
MNDKIIGIIGGMGPEATANCYMKIIKATKAKKDQDHFRIIIDSNAKIPDRTEAILGKGKNPIKEIINTGKNLEKTGVDVAMIPCMTSHYFIEEVQKHLKFPILNAFIETNNYIKSTYPNAKKVGVLATSGTLKTQLFNKYFGDIEVLYPSENSQNNKVMEAIYGERGIKQGHLTEEPLQLLKETAEELIQQGADLIISGCTEIELVLKQNHLSKPLIIPMDVVIEKLVK